MADTRIPAGTQVGINVHLVHHQEEHWPDPMRFDPMRFTPEQVKARHKYAWVPFGGGAHMCLGPAFRLYAGEDPAGPCAARAIEVQIAEGYEPEWQPWPIPQPKDGLKVTLQTALKIYRDAVLFPIAIAGGAEAVFVPVRRLVGRLWRFRLRRGIVVPVARLGEVLGTLRWRVQSYLQHGIAGPFLQSRIGALRW